MGIVARESALGVYLNPFCPVLSRMNRLLRLLIKGCIRRLGNSVFLTKSELEAMTGLVRPKAQANWCQDSRIPFLFRADGSLLVLRSAVEVKLGGTSSKSARSAQPHWDELNAQKTA